MQFEYVEPRTVDEIVSFLSEHRENAKIIAGGTDLLLKLKGKVIDTDYVVDIQKISELNYIQFEESGGLRIGANATLRQIETDSALQKTYPVISYSAKQIASVAIRNVATLGGNLCNGSPSADMAPGLMCLSGETKILGPGGSRTVPLEDFFLGPGKTVLEPGEVLSAVHVAPMAKNSAVSYLKHTTRGSVDLAIVGVAVMIRRDDSICGDIRISLGAVAPTPMRARTAEAAIMGKEADPALIEKVAAAAADECSPVSDVRASAGYRKELVKVLTRRAIMETWAKLNRTSPHS